MKCVRCKKHYSTVLVEHEDGTVEPVCELCYLDPFPKEEADESLQTDTRSKPEPVR